MAHRSSRAPSIPSDTSSSSGRSLRAPLAGDSIAHEGDSIGHRWLFDGRTMSPRLRANLLPSHWLCFAATLRADKWSWVALRGTSTVRTVRHVRALFYPPSAASVRRQLERPAAFLFLVLTRRTCRCLANTMETQSTSPVTPRSTTACATT